METGKIGQAEGQIGRIAMAKWLSESIYSVLCLWSSLYAVVSAYQNWSNEGQLPSGLQTPKLMYAREGEG